MYNSKYDKEINSYLELLLNTNKEISDLNNVCSNCQDIYFKICDSTSKADKGQFEEQFDGNKIKWEKARKDITNKNLLVQIIKTNLNALYYNKFIDFFQTYKNIEKFKDMPFRYKKFDKLINECCKCYASNNVGFLDITILDEGYYKSPGSNSQNILRFYRFYSYEKQGLFDTDKIKDFEKDKRDFIKFSDINKYFADYLKFVEDTQKKVDTFQADYNKNNKFSVGNCYQLQIDYKYNQYWM